MIVDITSQIVTELKTLLSGTAIVHSSYPSTTPEFPCIIVEELLNNDFTETIDTNGVKHNSVSIEVNIFTIGSTRMSQAKSIRGVIDTLLSGGYRMTRNYSNPVPNLVDETIYRYTMRYTFKIDSTKTIYRG